ncbi:hypothetical protein DAMA08_050580 [Martiniozyma asiatica (nom. inval.)]|nr:hypothetical protein DAMA08_050580 [Martiniozyma asiatica]
MHSPKTPQTPKKRRAAADFYSLLKSPEVNLSPGTKRPKPHPHAETSPYNIPQLTNNLKTRLNYANIKVQHGWAGKSINEVEQSLLSPPKQSYPQFSTPGPRMYNANIDLSPLPSPKFRRKSLPTISLDDIANNRTSPLKSTSLQLAPLLQPPQTPTQQQQRIPSLKLPNATTGELEQNAILSLMSLSSPVKHTPTPSPGHSPMMFKFPPNSLSGPPKGHFRTHSTHSNSTQSSETSSQGVLLGPPLGLGLPIVKKEVAAETEDEETEEENDLESEHDVTIHNNETDEDVTIDETE